MNTSTRESANVRKLIITGPTGSGKSSAIAAVVDSKIANDADNKDSTDSMDYGIFQMEKNCIVHIYGTLGQKRLDFMWDVLSESGAGLIILLDSTREDVAADLGNYVRVFSEFVERKQFVIGITRMDVQRNRGITPYRKILEQLEIRAPLFEVDARSQRDVTFLIRALLASEQYL